MECGDQDSQLGGRLALIVVGNRAYFAKTAVACSMQDKWTIHQYINQYPIAPESRKLILGTIHAHDRSKFKTDFFYGNRGSLWTLLHKAFPLELTEPESKKAIQAFLKARGIAMSDVVARCRRRKDTAMDADLIDIQLHEELLPQIRCVHFCTFARNEIPVPA